MAELTCTMLCQTIYWLLLLVLVAPDCKLYSDSLLVLDISTDCLTGYLCLSKDHTKNMQVIIASSLSNILL